MLWRKTSFVNDYVGVWKGDFHHYWPPQIKLFSSQRTFKVIEHLCLWLWKPWPFAKYVHLHFQCIHTHRLSYNNHKMTDLTAEGLRVGHIRFPCCQAKKRHNTTSSIVITLSGWPSCHPLHCSWTVCSLQYFQSFMLSEYQCLCLDPSIFILPLSEIICHYATKLVLKSRWYAVRSQH